MTHTVMDLERIFKRAASYGISEWSRPFSELDDLKQKLWEWYLKRPSTQAKLQKLKPHEVTNLVKRVAVQILSETQIENNNWEGKSRYTVENVKDALSGDSFNPYLWTILPAAFEDLVKQNAGYAESLASRYVTKAVPARQSKEQVTLSRAVKSLTDILNLRAAAEVAGPDKDGPGSKKPMQRRRPVFKHEEHPEVIKGKGDHSDPTANIAIMLIENPFDEDGNSIRDEYLAVEPITEYLRGPRRA